MKIPLLFLLFPLNLLLNSSLTAQIPIGADSTEISSPAFADSTQPDSLRLAKVDTIFFKIPRTGYEVRSERASEFLFQDLVQLFSNTLPAIPIITGEVGQPRYIASGELPVRGITTLVDSIDWIPGVYGTVDLTSLPEAGADDSKITGVNAPLHAPDAAITSLRVASEVVRYNEPLTRVSYSKGPYGADATRVGFSRAFSKRLTGVINIAFCNADGQFIDLPYEGHKARLRFDYRAFRQWHIAYLHFNTRNEAGVAVPFFPEEWPAVEGAFHKEERLYHALELAPSQKLRARAFYWQMKEELNDPARQIRHRLRNAGLEALWQRQRERLALSLYARAGKEEIHSNSIIPGSRLYGNSGGSFSWRPITGFWLQAEAQYQYKENWQAGQAFSLSGLWQLHDSVHLWLRARRQRLPPALGEKDNQLHYLSANPQLRAVHLSHFESGFSWRRDAFELQAQVGGGHWEDGFVFSTDSAAGPAYLRNDEHGEQSMAARLQLHWKFMKDAAVYLMGAQSLQELPRHYWFWYQPKGFARLHLEMRRTFFNRDLEALPRFSVRYLGERISPVFATGTVLPQFKTFGAVATFDFHLRLRYGSGALLLAWENLLNNRYQLRDGVPDAGLVLRWGFQWLFRD